MFVPSLYTAPLTLSASLGGSPAVLRVRSTVDGDATVWVRRTNSSVTHVDLGHGHCPGAVQEIANWGVSVTPEFSGGRTFDYVATAAWYTCFISVHPMYYSNVTLIVATENNISYPVLTNLNTPPIQLNTTLGTTTAVQLLSTDGVYTFTVARALPTIVAGSVLLTPFDYYNRTRGPLPMSQDWDPMQWSYVAHYTLNFTHQFVSFNVTYGGGIMVMERDGLVPPYGVSSVSSGGLIRYSGFLRLGLGVSNLRLRSQLDGTYTFSVTRLPPDLYYLAFMGRSFTADLGALPWESLQRAPNHVCVLPNHCNITVPWQVREFYIDARFNVSGSLQLYVNGTSTPQSLVSHVPTAPFQLDIGRTTVRMESTQDGVYYFEVWRGSMDLSVMKLTLFTAEPLAGVAPVVMSTVPALMPGMFTPPQYLRISIPHFYAAFTLTFATQFTVKIYNSSDPVNWRNGYNVTAVSGALTYFPLRAWTVNTFHIDSSEDGVYTVLIDRGGPPDVSRIHFQVRNNSDNTWSTVVTTPAFAPGNFHVPALSTDPAATLAYCQNAIRVYAEFAQSTMIVDWMLNGVLQVTRNLVAASALDFQFQPGLNRYRLNSNFDGVYQFNLRRSFQDVRSMSMGLMDVDGVEPIPLPMRREGHSSDYGWRNYQFDWNVNATWQVRTHRHRARVGVSESAVWHPNESGVVEFLTAFSSCRFLLSGSILA